MQLADLAGVYLNGLACSVLNSLCVIQCGQVACYEIDLFRRLIFLIVVSNQVVFPGSGEVIRLITKGFLNGDDEAEESRVTG